MPYYKKQKFYFNIKTSKLEKKFESILKILKLNYIRQYNLGTKFYDFYLPDHNLLIEVDGDYWHGNKKIIKGNLSKMQKRSKINDKLKDMLAEAAGKKIIRFWETDINSNQLYVINKLKELTNS